MNFAECKNSEKYCHKGIGIGIGNTFQKHIGIGIGNTSCQSIVIGGIVSSFQKYC